MPDMVFGANLSEDGSTVTDTATVEGSYQRVEAFPRHEPDCVLSMGFVAHGVTIKPGGSLYVLASVADIPDPPPPGTQLLARVFMPDGSKIDLAIPFVAG